ncbi:elongation factor P [Patescibacteria group bacterium]|nr:elongation factor P [Patescibacteria group bacterium]
MARLSYNELKVGTIFTKDGSPFKVLSSAFVRMQQRKPVMQLKIENLISGKVQEYSAHQNEEFEEAEIDIMPVQFIYENRGEYWFNEKGNPKNRFQLSKEILGNASQFLKPSTELTAYKFNEKIINVELPIKMDLKVTEAPPAIKGNTAQGGNKAVTLETGAKINVPLFIEEGDIIKINTETGEYIERV